MEHQIKRAAVIGAGVMGSGIAAHIANAGIPVHLLDLPGEDFGQKNALAEKAIERMLKTEPAAFVSAERAQLVTPGNLEDDFDVLAKCDWIIEAVVEKLDVKQALYARIESVMAPSTIVSSNTSTIPLEKLIEGRGDVFRQNFVITHFFNPPRYTRLLELVSGAATDSQVTQRVEDFCDRFLGKGVVKCHDRPGFIGNRIGTYWLLSAVQEAINADLSVETVDALFGRPVGLPKTGVFGLLDLVGIDLIPLIGASMVANLSAEDAYHRLYKDVPLIQNMIADGYTGRKGKGGFYRINQTEQGKVKESINLKTGAYSPSEKPRISVLENTRDLKTILADNSPEAQYLWRVLSDVLLYTANLVPEIADDVVAVDTAMKLGYNWKFGPFELLDKMGVPWFVEQLTREGRAVPALLAHSLPFYKIENGQRFFLSVKGAYEPIVTKEGHLSLTDIKLRTQPIAKNGSAALWDIGDGVVCLEFKTKMNAIDPDIMAMIFQSIEIVKARYKALVIYNDGDNFSAGVNLGLALFVANTGAWPLISDIVQQGQKAYQALKFAPFPVVGAPSGMALGGGCEVLLHCDAVQAHVETYAGLVEVGVGVIPAWGGCKEMILRHTKNGANGGMMAISKVFEMIGTAKVAKSAVEAKDMLILRPNDGITMNKDRVLADAKTKALQLADAYAPPVEEAIKLPGATARVALSMAVKGLVKMGKATLYDQTVSKELSIVLTGGEADQTDTLTEKNVLALEHESFMRLIKNQQTLARMEHTLETGKPLRN